MSWYASAGIGGLILGAICLMSRLIPSRSDQPFSMSRLQQNTTVNT